MWINIRKRLLQSVKKKEPNEEGSELPIMCEHERADTLGHIRVGRIWGSHLHRQVVVCDVKDKLAIAKIKAQKIVLAVRVVVLVEVREPRPFGGPQR
jgi:hypothetical protein